MQILMRASSGPHLEIIAFGSPLQNQSLQGLHCYLLVKKCLQPIKVSFSRSRTGSLVKFTTLHALCMKYFSFREKEFHSS